MKFSWIDLDDELSVAIGRARLANATAIQILVDKHILLPNEGRQQLIADGLITISVPESVDGGDEFPELPVSSQERPGLLGKPIAPSQGGYGEVKSKAVFYDTIEDDVLEYNLQENLLEEISDENEAVTI